ncbi:MAG: glycosyltransferase [Nitrososphaerales archaeon]
MTGQSVDITVPVLNEEKCVVQSLERLVNHLETECPHDWTVTVVDNGSGDRTWSLVTSFAADNARVRVIRLDQPGRGGALKAAWSTSDSDVVAYMDVDLSTSLDSLPCLLDPIVDGDADVVIGSRLVSGAKITRSALRELTSRVYNGITRVAFRYGIRDAQCGFKAVRASVAQALIPSVHDEGWFFDTELLVLASRSGFKIREIPVRWTEDDDSRVRIVPTALDDLRGIWRLWLTGRDRLMGSRKDSRRATSLPTPASEEDLAVDFDEIAKRYEEAVNQSVSFTRRNAAFYAERKVEILESIAMRNLQPLRRQSVLDVGCGTGTADRFLKHKVQHLCGVDVSEEMLAIARRDVPEALYKWYDGDKLPFEDNTFDVVLASCVLHHVPRSNRFKFVSEMNRVARQDGLIVLFEHNPFNPLTRLAVNSCALDKEAILVTSQQTIALMKETGAADPRSCNYLFTPFGGRIARGFDRLLNRLPLGGQYAVWAKASGR